VFKVIESPERAETLSATFLQGLVAWFEGYTAGFPQDDPELAFGFTLKVEHTRRTVTLMRELAAAEGLEVNLACACALLHDLGRFPQLLRYRTFVDAKSVNHASLSCDVLDAQQVLRGLDATRIQIIRGSILQHNARVLPEGLDPGILPYAHALRDADKLDILFIHISGHEAGLPPERIPGHRLPDNGHISPAVLEAVRLGRPLARSELTSLDDAKLLLAGWLHDLNTRRACQVFQEECYLERLFALLPQEETLAQLYRQLRAHLEARSGLR